VDFDYWLSIAALSLLFRSNGKNLKKFLDIASFG
jgi:hypothetical protein